MTTALADFDFQMLIWGWAVDAHDDIALLCEQPTAIPSGWWWDFGAVDVMRWAVCRDGVWQQAPDWHALVDAVKAMEAHPPLPVLDCSDRPDHEAEIRFAELFEEGE